MDKSKTVELGDEVKCKISGWKGLVTGLTKHLTGCDRANVQAPIQPDGKYGDSYAIDIAALEIIEKQKVKPDAVQEPVLKGGPATKVSPR